MTPDECVRMRKRVWLVFKLAEGPITPRSPFPEFLGEFATVEDAKAAVPGKWAAIDDRHWVSGQMSLEEWSAPEC